MKDVFKNAESFNQDITMWNVENVTSYDGFNDGSSPLKPSYLPNFKF